MQLAFTFIRETGASCHMKLADVESTAQLYECVFFSSSVVYFHFNFIMILDTVLQTKAPWNETVVIIILLVNHEHIKTTVTCIHNYITKVNCVLHILGKFPSYTTKKSLVFINTFKMVLYYPWNRIVPQKVLYSGFIFLNVTLTQNQS